MRCERWTIQSGPARGATGWVILDAEGSRIDAPSGAPYHRTRAAAWAAVGGRPAAGRPGRPRLADPRSEILRVRLTVAEDAEVRRLAVMAGLSAADYVRSLVLP